MATLNKVEARIAQVAAKSSIQDFAEGIQLYMKMNPGENRRFEKAWSDADIPAIKDIIADYMDEMEVEPTTPPGALNRGRP